MYSAFALIATSVVTLAAYSNGDLDSSERKMIDRTDRSVCQGVTPSEMSLTKNDWTTQDLLTNGVTLERTMHFESDSVEVVVKATYQNDSRQIRVRSGIQANLNRFEILSSDSDRAHLPVAGNTVFVLSFDLSPMTVSYSFVGPCLQIDSGSDVLIFTPKSE